MAQRQEQPVSEDDLAEMPEKIEEAFDDVRNELPADEDEA
jgi:hypothetical protein